jgi:ABC-type glycerol-3-phosphate transport system substrate-binding protein
VYTHFIPLTNEDGRLIVSTPTKLAISSNSNHKEAAWKFIKYAIDAREAFGFDSLMSIKKSIAQKTYSEEIRRILDQSTSSEGDIVFAADKEYAHDVAIKKLMNISAMPLVYAKSDSYSDYIKTLEQFRLGIMTAEQMASELQNKTEIWLKE